MGSSMPGWSHPTILSSGVPFPLAFNLSQCQGLFQWVSSSHQVAKVMEIQIQHQSFQWIFGNKGLISFRIDWFYLLVVQGTLKSLLQHHSSKASIPQCSAFLMVQLSHPYMTTGKTIVLPRWIFVGKVTSMLLNMLSRFVITFLQTSMRLLISWMQSPSSRAHTNTVCHCFPWFLIYSPWSNGARCYDLHFLNIKIWASFFTLFFHLYQEAL